MVSAEEVFHHLEPLRILFVYRLSAMIKVESSVQGCNELSWMVPIKVLGRKAAQSSVLLHVHVLHLVPLKPVLPTRSKLS